GEAGKLAKGENTPLVLAFYLLFHCRKDVDSAFYAVSAHAINGVIDSDGNGGQRIAIGTAGIDVISGYQLDLELPLEITEFVRIEAGWGLRMVRNMINH